jgi:dolichol kinase
MFCEGFLFGCITSIYEKDTPNSISHLFICFLVCMALGRTMAATCGLVYKVRPELNECIDDKKSFHKL